HLAQNFPNPFNPTTNIKYSIPEAGKISLIVFNILGEEVVTLANEFKAAGNYEVNFDATELPSGIYF
ncbi:MAG: T9SS type A sorting domain-containing protein, partial [Gammaproteobacteria bacterium]|nr:T9SS type A sorting domain-containing protein [Gammaproteobacteria bacterium]NIW44341.1 T9SS type A sorting domain-containing protein [Gammaproteobacteria bacterium]NIX55454.1 T9SS type A sorting domain-containing protein [candidate division Zixibacteria bacterium]